VSEGAEGTIIYIMESSPLLSPHYIIVSRL
jgi:hypothetical protein